jgi:hypothetical protein
MPSLRIVAAPLRRFAAERIERGEDALDPLLDVAHGNRAARGSQLQLPPGRAASGRVNRVHAEMWATLEGRYEAAASR